MSTPGSEFQSLTLLLRDFAQRRDWGKFHTPKNLAMATTGEAGELAAEFQWLTPEESRRENLSSEKLNAVAMEIADVQIYLLRLADVLKIDVPTAVRTKISINESRFHTPS
ncbi:MAG: nucleotide pyrophosphohydrolase [Actinomycetota bacterium]